MVFVDKYLIRDISDDPKLKGVSREQIKEAILNASDRYSYGANTQVGYSATAKIKGREKEFKIHIHHNRRLNQYSYEIEEKNINTFENFFNEKEEDGKELLNYIEKSRDVGKFAKENNLTRNEIRDAVKQNFLFEVGRNFYLQYDFYTGMGKIKGDEIIIKANANSDKFRYEIWNKSDKND